MLSSEEIKIIARQAFDVYSAQIVKEAVEKNNQIKQENNQLENAKDFLNKIKIFNRDDFPVEFYLNDTSNEEVTIPDEDPPFVSYETPRDIEIPVEKLHLLSFAVSGVFLGSGTSSLFNDGVFNGDGSPKMTVLDDDETIELQLGFRGSSLIATGILEGFVGTIEDVKQMIRDNRHTGFFLSLGMMSSSGELPGFFRQEGILDGGVFSLKKIEVAKNLVDWMPLRADSISGLAVEEDDLVDLKNLVEVDENHKEALMALAERKCLNQEHFYLSNAHNRLNSITAQYDGGFLKLLLTHGQKGSSIDDDPVPVWEIVTPPKCPDKPRLLDQYTIPVQHITKMKFKLSGVPYSHRPGPMMVAQPRFTADWYLVIKYSPVLTAIFNFDESIKDFEQDTNLIRLIQATLYNDEAAAAKLNGLTMRLVCLHIKLTVIKPHLEALEIDADTNGQFES